MRTTLLPVAAALLLAGCGGSRQPVRPDDMSAEQHRREAAREHAQADAHLAAFEADSTESPNPPRPINPDDQYLYPVTVYNPTESHLEQAAAHEAHAAEHEKAAAELERFEEAECADFPPRTRAACPILLHVAAVEDVPSGVRVRFSPDAPVAAVVAHMRCHLAWARTRGYAKETTCPLYEKGVSVKPSPDGRAVEMYGTGAEQVQRLRHEIRLEIIPEH